MNSKLIFDFLRGIEAHNNKVWFDAHRNEYQAARKEWLGFVEETLGFLGTLDKAFFQADPRKCIFRINRDVRFSRNKNPYKTNFGAFFVPGGKNSGNACYYIHLEPGNCAIAGGMYYPAKPHLDRVREHIDKSKNELSKIITTPEFKKYFNDIDRSHSLKRKPNGYSEEHPQIDLIKLKSFTVWHHLSDAQVGKPSFKKMVEQNFKAMEDFINFLNRG